MQRPEGVTAGNYYVEVNAIGKDEKGHYLWKAESLTVDQLKSDFSPVVTARKAYITPGEGRIAVLQLYTFREITELGGINKSALTSSWIAAATICSGVCLRPE